MQRFEFKPIGAEIDETDPVARLVQLARQKAIASSAWLDQPLSPIWRAQPVYPAILRAGDRPKGRATIEFVVDRGGRARLPRIVAATRPEFGWSAATAIAQWVFQPPRRGGGPADVRVQIPVEFSPD